MHKQQAALSCIEPKCTCFLDQAGSDLREHAVGRRQTLAFWQG
jgi:hypothetical protein